MNMYNCCDLINNVPDLIKFHTENGILVMSL